MTPAIMRGHRFSQPVYWNNDDESWPYSKGGTANIIRFRGEFFIISAAHVLTKKDRKISDVFIPHRLNSSSRIRVGGGVGFTPKSEEQEDTAHQDIQIHHIPPFTSDRKRT